MKFMWLSTLLSSCYAFVLNNRFMSTYDFIKTNQSTSEELAMYGLIMRAHHDSTLWLSHFLHIIFNKKEKMVMN